MSLESKTATRKSNTGWTLDSALDWLDFNPHDTIMQYIALRMAMREGRLADITQRINITNGLARARFQNRPTDLFSIFSGATAVHESLQLEAMMPPGSLFDQGVRPDQPNNQKYKSSVSISQLAGPVIESHPWKEMLGDKTPNISKIASKIPADFFLLEGTSVPKLLDALNGLASWQSYVSIQGFQNASHQRGAERVKKQLMLDGRQLELLMNSEIEEIGIAGSDLSIAEGSDISVVVLAKSELTQQLYDHVRSDGEHTGAMCSQFTIGNWQCQQVTDADRTISTFACNPSADLHIRSNSRMALEEILKTVASDNNSLGATLEYRYIRTLMPCDRDEEDMFIYLSDPFIRRLVGPNLRIAQRRRRICFNHLRMLSSAILLYISEHGHAPQSFAQLAESGCTSHSFNEDTLVCPDGGIYSLHAGNSDSIPNGVCSRHGYDQFLTPSLETPVKIATAEEANEYDLFLEQYNQYWRTYFDPIGIRAKIHDNQYKLQTIVLPLIDNSIYSGMATVLGGEPQALANRVMLDDVFLTTAVKVNKNLILQDTGAVVLLGNLLDRKNDANLDIHEFIVNGIGDQISFHVCDEKPAFTMDALSLLGNASTFGGAGSMLRNPTILTIVAALLSLHSPVYACIDVEDQNIVDQFFASLKPLLVKGSAVDAMLIGSDFAITDIGDNRHVYSKVLKVGPARLRLHWARIGRKIYLASQLELMERLWNLRDVEHVSNTAKDPESEALLHPFLAHAVVEILPSRWKKSLSDLKQTWQENSRLACQKNLGSLTVLARALDQLKSTKNGEDSVLPGDLHSITEHPALGVSRVCPRGGIYSYDAASGHVKCSMHGTVLAPIQQAGTICDGSELLPQQLKRATAALKFLEDGLHAELILER